MALKGAGAGVVCAYGSASRVVTAAMTSAATTSSGALHRDAASRRLSRAVGNRRARGVITSIAFVAIAIGALAVQLLSRVRCRVGWSATASAETAGCRATRRHRGRRFHRGHTRGEVAVAHDVPSLGKPRFDRRTPLVAVGDMEQLHHVGSELRSPASADPDADGRGVVGNEVNCTRRPRDSSQSRRRSAWVCLPAA